MSSTLPLDFVRRIKNQFGVESDAFFEALENVPATSIRLNFLKQKPSLDYNSSVPWCEHGFYLNQRPQYTLDPLFHAGAYYPQESSSMVLWHVLNAILDKDKHPVCLDLCAAPGGKTTLTASFLDGKGVLIANEVIRARTNVLKENVIKCGFSNIIVSQNDSVDFINLPSLFDLALVDAPCSGEGIFRKDPSSRQEWTLDNVTTCELRQRRIVSNIWPSIKEGGYLVYSTCTFNPGENEDNIEWLLAREDAQVVSIPVPDAWPIAKVKVDAGHGYAFYPHRTVGEGFFIVVVQKNSSADKFPKSTTQRQKVKASLPSNLIQNQTDFDVVEFNGLFSLFNINQLPILHLVEKHLKVVYRGLEVGSFMRNDLNPSHSLAMSTALGEFYPRVELPLNQALRYLKGETHLDVTLDKGWYIVTYQSQPLGFVKSVGARLNNYYPKEFRIRMAIS